MATTTEWFSGYDDKIKSTMVSESYPYKVIDYKTMDQTATDKARELLWKSAFMRKNLFPAKWVYDVERKALRQLERSFDLRHMFDRRYPRPDVLPPATYDRDTQPPKPSNVIPNH